MGGVGGDIGVDVVVGGNVLDKFKLKLIVFRPDGFECFSIESALYHDHGVVCVVAATSSVDGDYRVSELCEGGEVFSWSDEVGGEGVGVYCYRGSVFFHFCQCFDEVVELSEFRISVGCVRWTWSWLSFCGYCG